MTTHTAGRPRSYPVEHHASAESDTTIVLLHGGNVANWMWDPQVKALTDHHVLTPHLPGFGNRAGEIWQSLAATADDVAATIAAHARGGRAHVVGLSLGGVVTTRLLARHPEVVRSALITGVPLAGVHGLTRWLGDLQLGLWDKRWFWQAQSYAFGLPAEDRDLFVEHGLTVSKDNAVRLMREVYDGGAPDGIGAYRGRLLAIAGGKESASVRRSFPHLRRAVPQVECRIAPGMHHAWNIEDAGLFTDVVRAWVHGEVDPRLRPA
ncbi:alpha/beta fold hydrolase [Georgenia thermotolerans]|uniref:Alpha/beta fold hydrolase n=1 Tax=Georgenia thermotolerans TaxID=527326 RepID=A0A7J5UV58_9MICO|nr:alpha/beta hydrolase [Georgenia thermotolerans]KAE8766156.1 alpha/beta fold hydrolase [Georgenia thermotolerans]